MRAAVIGVALLLWPFAVHAQVCAGRASFNVNRVQAGGGAGWSSAGKDFRAAAGVGTDRAFGLVSLARDPLDDAASVSIVATAATDQALTLDNRLHGCPMLSLGYRWPEAGGTGIRRSGAAVGAALHVGYLALNRRTAAVVPTVYLSLSREPTRTGFGRAVSAGAGLGVIRLRGLAVRGEGAVRWMRATRGVRVAVTAMYGF